MIKTEIFHSYSRNNYYCFEDVLKMVNDLITENGIKKEDVIEYRTENWETQENGEEIWHYRATISWWE